MLKNKLMKKPKFTNFLVHQNESKCIIYYQKHLRLKIAQRKFLSIISHHKFRSKGFFSSNQLFRFVNVTLQLIISPAGLRAIKNCWKTET